jgi:carbon-monoxide dehydrogenase medium subunit
MKPAPFDYHAPRDLDTALKLLSTLDNARVLAGGQSLVPMLNLRLAMPDQLIDLGNIAELAGITENAETLTIGAMTRQRDIERSAEVRLRCPLLTEAISHVGHQQTRNRGTIGGSLCHLDPAAELPVVACALDARLHVAGPARERRWIAFADFPAGYLTTQLQPDEILVAVEFPLVPRRTGVAFVEFARRPADFAIVSAAVSVTIDAQATITGARIALGGLGPAPRRVPAAEAALVGQRGERAAFERAAAISASLPAEGDELYPGPYRQELARVLTQRALEQASSRAGHASDA